MAALHRINPQEAEHDFATGSKNLELKLGHILYHLRESKSNLKVILSSESGEVFVHFLKDYLEELFIKYIDDFSSEIPRDLSYYMAMVGK